MPNIVHDTSGPSIWPPASMTDTSIREFDFVNIRALTPAPMNASTMPNCILANRYPRIALAVQLTCSKSVYNDRPYHRHWPTVHDDVVTRQLLSPQPYAPNTIELDSVNVDSTRTDGYRYRRWPDIDCRATISGRTPLVDDQSNGVRIQALASVCLVA